MVNSGKQLIPCETKISAYTGETPMPPWPLRLTPFPHTSGFLKLELRASFYGKKIRRFFATEAKAFEEGQKLVTLVRKKGTQAIYGDDGMSVAQALRMWSVEADGKSKATLIKSPLP